VEKSLTSAIGRGLAAGLVGTAFMTAYQLAVGVWTAAYAELVPLGIYKKPLEYPAQELALDLSYHLVYGIAVAGAYSAFDR
jgi:hypothetical protein